MTRLLILALLLAGCDSRTMEQSAKVDTVNIQWIRATPTECMGEPQHYGCARWTDDRKFCQITMPADANDALIAHEFRHCFGFSHLN